MKKQEHKYKEKFRDPYAIDPRMRKGHTHVPRKSSRKSKKQKIQVGDYED